MESDEGIYLIHTREFRSLNEIIYKIGRSYDLDVRIRQYPKKSKIIFAINCENSLLCERELMKIFKSKFIQKLDYGTEYFEGDKKEMIKEIYNYIDKMNIKKKKDNKEKKKKEIKKIKEKKEKHEKEVKENKDIIENTIIENEIIENEIIKNEKVEIIKINKKYNTTCPKCKYTFEYPSRLKRHFALSSRCSISNEEIELFFNPRVNSIKCDICNKDFSRKDSLNRHIKNSKCDKPKI
jgi:hypothetical protein